MFCAFVLFLERSSLEKNLSRACMLCQISSINEIIQNTNLIGCNLCFSSFQLSFVQLTKNVKFYLLKNIN